MRLHWLLVCYQILYCDLFQCLRIECIESIQRHIQDSGLTNQPNFYVKKSANSFPSVSFLQNKVYDMATMCTLQVADKLKGKPVHFGTDKGMIHMLYIYMLVCVYLHRAVD
jgi:hypothetical protein